jgi:hypothetical protein
MEIKTLRIKKKFELRNQFDIIKLMNNIPEKRHVAILIPYYKENEGEYEKYFSEEEIKAEEKLILQDKVILQNFFGLIKRNNPYL